jgi:type I restriction enzyme S subunit
MIPKEWKKKAVGHLFEVQLGKMLNEKAKNGTQYPYLANFNVRWGNFDFSKTNKMYFSQREKEKYALRDGDLLMCEGGEIGRCAVWHGHDSEIYYQKALHRIRSITDECSTDYLFIYMQFIAERGRLVRLVGETSIAHLTREKLLGLSILLPSPAEQKAIAEVLSVWDRAIEKTERLILAKEKRIKHLSNNFLFGNQRLGQQSEPLIRGRFFNYPMDWRLVSLNKIASEISVRNSNPNAVVLSCSKYDGFVNSLDYFGKKVFSDDTTNYKVIKNWQFGYPANHIEEGSIGLLEHCDEGIVSPIYVVFETSAEIVHPPYLIKLLKTDIFRHIFRISTSSSVDRRGSLRWHEFSTLKVALPPMEEQKRIAEMLNLAQREIELLKKLAEKQKLQKRGLMQKLLTGEWRVTMEG